MKITGLATIAKHILMINDSLPYHVNSVYHDKQIELEIFEQLWPDTSGGMCMPGQVACSAMTLQTTYVIHNKELNVYHVFFDGLFAYMIQGNQANELFFTDLQSKNLKNRGRHKEYILNRNEEDN